MQQVLSFGGETFDKALDGVRLTSQLNRVFVVMSDGKWHTLAELSKSCGGTEAAISARIRDFRKEKFGGREVQRQRVDGSGLWAYRLVL